ncbi:formiminoglutamase/guanidinobutyrase [Hymenobacter luteus]|uniref:Formiminoglutamase/guanidinobutyrase n=2 Tax=Hymenobacter TaxID=89966 RepID=A0A7W9SZ91_9BACT|nr:MULTISPECIES: arginase family protein [Hymenobacter]MBB4601142.1 formiminoglutamase/guanidinobutyrase [Hymenobacter latericoloratus]MBB6058651.1 formiminoglutamase/guanidinobutyrase [Hymenobacter luteus]
MPTFIRDLLRPATELAQADVCLVGLPLDFGTVLEGGRAGAAGGPEAIRRELCRYHKTYNLEHNVSLEGLRIADAGNLDLRPTPDHEANHQTIRAELTRLLLQYPRVVVLGGSHDCTYSTVRALRDATNGQAVGGINLDAHADVKDRPGLLSSGTPFGRLLREEVLAGERFTEIGLHSNLNTREDIDFLHQQQATLVPLAHVQHDGMAGYMRRALRRATAAGPAFVSFDIDGCAEAYAPAVSAPSADGFTPRQAVEAAFLAGKEPEVLLFELMELNPLFDRDNQTARLAATILTAYLTGIAATLSA